MGRAEGYVAERVALGLESCCPVSHFSKDETQVRNMHQLDQD
jgi:hypothetical protein